MLLARHCVFHSTCEAETGYIKQQFKHNVRIKEITNYVEVPKLVEREPARYFLFIGRLNLKKGIDALIRSLALSKEFIRSDHILKIAGRGDQQYVERLKLLVEALALTAKVEFIGQVEGKDKQQLFADAHWTFMPSHTENFGMVVLESLAQNTPVLASTNSPWRSLEDEKVGCWVDNSPEVLAGAIDEIIAMPAGEYESYRRRSRSFVERFDVRTHIHKWARFYKSLMK